MDAEDGVDLFDLCKRDLLEPIEQFQRFRVAVLDSLEPGPRLIVQRGICLHLLMIAHIDLDQLIHAALIDGVVIAPELVRHDHLAKLRAPVAEVVDAHGRKAEVVIDAVQRVADHGGRQVADVERLCDVDRGIVDADVAFLP